MLEGSRFRLRPFSATWPLLIMLLLSSAAGQVDRLVPLLTAVLYLNRLAERFVIAALCGAKARLGTQQRRQVLLPRWGLAAYVQTSWALECRSTLAAT